MKPSSKLRRSMRLVANELAGFGNAGELSVAERVIAERVVNDLRWLADRIEAQA